MKTTTKNILLGASVVAFAGLCAVGGYFFAKKTEKNSTDDSKDYDIASDSDLYEDDDDYEDYDYADYDYSEMFDYVTVGDYKGLKLNKVVPVADDIDDYVVEDNLEYYLEEYREFKDITDRGIKEGDYLNIDYSFAIDGTTLEDYSEAETNLIVGEGDYFKAFEDALIGLMPKSTTDIELTIPDDFVFDEEEGAEYIGKNAIFTITINDVKECTYTPELTDEFVKEKVDGCNTVEEWKKLLKQDELDYLTDEANEQLKSDIYTALTEITEFTDYEGLVKAYPDLYDDKIEEISNEYDSYASMFGMTLEEYMAFIGMEEDGLETAAKDAIKAEIAFAYIISKENLSVSDDKINAFVESEYKDYDYDSVDEFWEDYEKEEVAEFLINDVCYEFIIANADITEMTQSEYDKLMGYDDNDDGDDADFSDDADYSDDDDDFSDGEDSDPEDID